MALQFNPYPLEPWLQKQQREQQPDFNQTVTQPLLQGLQLWQQQQQATQNAKRQAQLDEWLRQENVRKQEEHDFNYRGQPNPLSLFSGLGNSANQVAGPGGGSKLMNDWNSFMSTLKPRGAKERELAMKESEADALNAQRRAQAWKDMNPASAKAPPGFRFTSSGELEAIPGGPADLKELTAKQKTDQALKGQMDQADLVINKVDQALGKVGGFTAGLGGSILGRLPGTKATDLESDIDTIKAILGFNQLTEMRKASPTGGALGQVSDREIKLLTSSMASLDRAQSPEQLKARLNEVKTHYQNWIKTMQGVNPDTESGMQASGRMSATNPKTGQKLYSDDGGQTWHQ